MLCWRLRVFDSSILRRGCLLLIAVFVAGCGGIHSLSVYAPLEPAPLEDHASFRQEGYRWVLDLVDVEVSVGPVVLSERLNWIVGPAIIIPAFLWEEDVAREGPLAIYIVVKARPDAYVEYDPREFSVILEDGQALSPKSATPWPSSTETKPLDPVALSPDQEWRASLQYDVPRVGLKPFTLRLGVLVVNGRPRDVPALSFQAGDLWQSSRIGSSGCVFGGCPRRSGYVKPLPGPAAGGSSDYRATSPIAAT